MVVFLGVQDWHGFFDSNPSRVWDELGFFKIHHYFDKREIKTIGPWPGHDHILPKLSQFPFL